MAHDEASDYKRKPRQHNRALVLAAGCGCSVGTIGLWSRCGQQDDQAKHSAFLSPNSRLPSSLIGGVQQRNSAAQSGGLRALPSTGDGRTATFIASGAVAAIAAIASNRGRKFSQRQIRRHASEASSADSIKLDTPAQGHFPPMATPLLDSLNNEGPKGIRTMSIQQLEELAEEVRWQVLDAVSVTGGHLGAGLGVLDLTVALHHVFDTPDDEIVWDVAHQCQPHKVLTGRRDRIYTLRQGGGLSGFTKRKESPYDNFGAGHSGTSISAAVGFEEARKRQGKKGHTIAVIGDGAITGGMAFEALNHAGGVKSKVIVILNDNGQVSLPTNYNTVESPVGGLAKTLASQGIDTSGLKIQGTIAKMETSDAFQQGRQFLKETGKQMFGEQFSTAAAKIDEYARDFIKTVPFRGSGAGAKGELFEQLGAYYVGPIDGHDMETLVEVLKNVKNQHDTDQLQKPVVIHIKTRKGKGYEPAEEARDRLHAVKPKFNVPKPPPQVTDGAEAKPSKKSLTSIFAEALVKEAEKDDKIVAVTAAMPGGTGISIFEKRFGPDRTFDVGIAEQHAVTMAGSLAAGGLKPFCAIYSTFLQRGYDQLVHDVALQNLPVRFIIDRAGLVGADGPTHGGTFDLSYMACIPNLKICAPADEAELVHMVHTVAMIDDCPTAVRYPRGNGYGDVELPEEPMFLEPGKGRIIREGSDGTIALLSVGARLRECLKAADRLEQWGIHATVADARWVKPLDAELVGKLAAEHRVLITIEENSIGGFSAMVQQELLNHGYLDGLDKTPLAFRSMTFPDRFIEAHHDAYMQYEDAELNASSIVEKAITVLSRVGVKVDAPVQS